MAGDMHIRYSVCTSEITVCLICTDRNRRMWIWTQNRRQGLTERPHVERSRTIKTAGTFPATSSKRESASRQTAWLCQPINDLDSETSEWRRVTFSKSENNTIHLPTYSMEHSPSWEANQFSASQEIPLILWNPKVHYRIHKCPPWKWVAVTTAWRVLRLWMEERPPIWRVAANILNKQSRTVDKERSSSLGVGRGANNSSP